MRIVVFSGTTEGRELSRRLAAAGAEVTVCVASEYGSEEQGRCPGVETRTGALSAGEKAELLRGAALCVDATHPYARHVTDSVRTACAAAGVRCLRLLRAPSDTGEALVVGSAAEAAALLAEREGRVLLSTGARELPAYAGLDPVRLYPRILPSHESLAACEALGIPHRNIIAMQGPFTREMNAATLRQYGIRYLVTKDGGAPGGFPEKADAARETGAELIVLRRPEEEGLDFEQVWKVCKTLLDGAAIEQKTKGENP